MFERIRDTLAVTALILGPILSAPASAQQPPALAPMGQMCIENHSPARVDVDEGIVGLKQRRFFVDLEPARYGPNGIEPVRVCEDYLKLNQRDTIGPRTIVWLEATWSTMVGGIGSGLSGNPGMAYERVCDLDVRAGGVVVIRYDGALNADDKPVASKFRCDRYDPDGALRTEVLQPQPARWAGRPRCEERYPRSGTWDKAFGHQTTGQCYRCPVGFARTIWGIDAGNACEKGGVLGIGSSHSRTQKAGPECGNPESGRQNFRNGVLDQCYSCPSGWSNPAFGTISGDLTRVPNACRPPGYPW
jgi:hypothetical protein